MSSEAEFKKRLLGFAEQLDGEFSLPTDPVTYVDMFNEILDLAATEFPFEVDAKMSTFCKEFLDMSLIPNVDPEKGYVRAINKLDKKHFCRIIVWFAKWFGEVPK